MASCSAASATAEEPSICADASAVALATPRWARRAASRSPISTGSPTSTRTVCPVRGALPRGWIFCMPSCTKGTMTGSAAAPLAASPASQPTPRLALRSVAPPSRERVPSGKICTHSPSRSRSRISRMPAWSAPSPRRTGTTLPAAKKHCVNAVRKQFSSAHSVQRMRPAVNSLSNGTSVEGSSGSSNAATWFDTVRSGEPCGRSSSARKKCSTPCASNVLASVSHARPLYPTAPITSGRRNSANADA
mmetsp:Transcript_1281/g.3732  ORF Transcript_1281/g.3732 Transcript_1281/m.3732 type:complete len:248 (-) Transcript_1281:53-796(-)